MNEFIAKATVDADKSALAEIATAFTAEAAAKEKELGEAKLAAEAAEETAEEAKKMLLEATEQLDGMVNTKKGVSKATVKEGGKTYLVNPNRKFNGVPGHGDRVFTGKDVLENVATVAYEGTQVKLRAYLAATGASIMQETGGE